MTPHALSRIRMEARERDAVLEKFYDAYEVPGGVPATGISTMHDATIVAGDALIHRGGIVPLPNIGKGRIAIRIDIGPIRSDAQNANVIVSAALRRIGSDLHGTFGPGSVDCAVPLAGWHDAGNMMASFILSMKENDYETWRLSDLPTARCTTAIAGRPIVPHDSSIFDQKALHPILSGRIGDLDEQRRRRVDPVLSAVSIVILIVSGVLACASGATPATLLTAFASLSIGMMSRVGRHEKSPLAMRILRANKHGISIMIACAALLSVALPSGLAHLPMTLVAMIILVGVTNGYEYEFGRRQDAPNTSGEGDGAGAPRTLKDGDGDAIESILHACGILPVHRQEDARLAAETCRMIEGFDPSDPLVHEARGSIDGLKNLLLAHENAMRYARDEERSIETQKLVDGLVSAALVVETARKGLLRAASQQVDTHARYLASRAPSVLDRTT